MTSERTTKVFAAVTPTGSLAYQFFGYVNGVAVHQSRKLWRYKTDAKRAARNWERNAK